MQLLFVVVAGAKLDVIREQFAMISDGCREAGVRAIRRPPPPPPSEEYAGLVLCYNFAMSPIVDAVMCMVTVLNVIVLMLTYEGQGVGLTSFIDGASNVFTGIFTAEAVLKILGLRPFW